MLLTAPDSDLNETSDHHSWFEYKNMDLKLEDLDSFLDTEQLKNNAQKIIDIIYHEVETHLNNDFTKVFLSGFSQGAALSMYIGYNIPERLGGVFALSGHQILDINDILN